MKLNQTALGKAKSVLKQKGAALAYLFGSFADGSAVRESDIDIAVLLPRGLAKNKRMDLRIELIGTLSRALKRKTEVVVCNDIASLLFKYAIIKEGRLIYRASEEEQTDFESKLMSLYFDFQPFLNFYNRQYVKNNLQ